MEVICPKCGASDDMDVTHIPPGKALLRCENCFETFEVEILPSNVTLAQCIPLGKNLVVHCPFCSQEFNTSLNIAKRSIIWACPSCGSIFRLPEPKRDAVSDEQPSEQPFDESQPFELGEISAGGLEELGKQLGLNEKGIEGITTEPFSIEDSDILLPPLTDKERFTGHFLVKINGTELGPISFVVLENWARSGMLPPEALVSKTDEARFHRADKMPELVKIFKGGTHEPGKAIKEMLSEKTSGEIIVHGIASGLIGGLIGGILASPIVLLQIWQPLPAFSAPLAALITAIGTAIAGAGMAAITAMLGLWVIEYAWTTLVQIIIAAIFAIIAFAANFFVSRLLDASAISAGGVLIIVFLVGYFTCQIHHKLYEKEV